MASAQSFGAKVLKSALQFGSAVKNYASYATQSLFSDDKEALWREFVTKTKSEFDYFEGAAGDAYKSIIEK